jgi:hypothetical protein
MTPVPLVPHPSTPAAYVRQLLVNVEWRRRDLLVLAYRLDCDIDSLLLPPRAAPDRIDELWRHTCFEAFLASTRSTAYVEFNFSPSSAWAAYRFDDYRRGLSPAPLGDAPRVQVERHERCLELTALVHLAGLAEFTADGLRLGLSAVLLDRSGQNSYWALAHAPGKPDFHHVDSYALALRAPAGEIE